MTAPEAVHILLVEDDAADVWFIRDTFEYFKVGNPLHVVSDGVAALRFVRREAPYQEAPRPGLMLLDLDLPGMDGLDVLGELVRDELLRDIAVVVLTASDVEADRFRGLRLGAAAYLTKPVDFTSLVDIVCTVDAMHFSVVRGHADS